MLKFFPRLTRFYSIAVFSSRSSSAGIDCFLKDRRKKIHQILKCFLLNVRKKVCFMGHIEALLSSEKSSGHAKRSFWNDSKIEKSLDQTQKPSITISVKNYISSKNILEDKNYISRALFKKQPPKTEISTPKVRRQLKN